MDYEKAWGLLWKEAMQENGDVPFCRGWLLMKIKQIEEETEEDTLDTHRKVVTFERDQDVKIHIGTFFAVFDAHIINNKGRIIIEAEDEIVNSHKCNDANCKDCQTKKK